MISTFSTIGAWLFPCKLSANLCMWRLPDIVHWLAERQSSRLESYFKYGRSKRSISQKRERESLKASGDELLAWWCCFSYEMEESKWGTLHQVIFNYFTSRKLERIFFLNLFFILFVHVVEIRRIADMHMHAIVALVLFKTQLLHDTRHFVQSSLGYGYSVKA